MKKQSLLMGAALTGLLVATSGCSSYGKSTSQPADDAVGKCLGVNSCKAKSNCGTDQHACHGQNSCKGKGWLKMAKAKCDEMGGKFETF